MVWRALPETAAEVRAAIVGAALDPDRMLAWMVGRLGALSAEEADALPVFGAVVGTVLAGVLGGALTPEAQTAVSRALLAGQGRVEAKLNAVPVVTAEAVIAALRREGVIGRAVSQGVGEAEILALARRIAPDVRDVPAALRELVRAVEVATRVQAEGAAGSKPGDFVDEVLRRVAALNAEGRIDEGQAVVAAALADARNHRAKATAALLRALRLAEQQSVLARDAGAVAAAVLERLEVELPERAARFAALRAEQDGWYERGRDRGLALDLDVAIRLAEATFGVAAGADDRGAALNDLGIALRDAAAQRGDAALLARAGAAFRLALEELTRDRVPLDWATTQNNLGTALWTLGERSGTEADLRAAVGAYRLALEERTRDRVPLDWAATQNNLGAALATLGEWTGREADLRDAVAAYRAALEERVRDRVPLDWAATQSNLAGAELAMFGLTGEAALWHAARDRAAGAVEVLRALGHAAHLRHAEARQAGIDAARP
jgi:hypothetical protein